MTTEQAVTVDLSKTSGTENAIGPGGTATFVFAVEITNSDKIYDLKLTELAGVTETESLKYAAWTVKVNDGTGTALSDGLTLISSVETAAAVTVSLTLSADAPIDWAGKNITFSLELVEQAA